jgi:hypothetical protein
LVLALIYILVYHIGSERLGAPLTQAFAALKDIVTPASSTGEGGYFVKYGMDYNTGILPKIPTMEAPA